MEAAAGFEEFVTVVEGRQRLRGSAAARRPPSDAQSPAHSPRRSTRGSLAASHEPVRAGTLRDPDVYARKLFTSRLVVVASPAYLAEHGPLGSVEDLAEHPCLRGFEAGTRPARTWPLPGGGTVAVDGPLASNDLTLIAEAACRGRGLALLPEVLIDEHLGDGRLVRLLEGVVGLDSTIAVVYAERRYLEPKVRAFIDYLVEALRTDPVAASP